MGQIEDIQYPKSDGKAEGGKSIDAAQQNASHQELNKV
jgi:hypothetical protein